MNTIRCPHCNQHTVLPNGSPSYLRGEVVHCTHCGKTFNYGVEESSYRASIPKKPPKHGDVRWYYPKDRHAPVEPGQAPFGAQGWPFLQQWRVDDRGRGSWMPVEEVFAEEEEEGNGY